MTTRKRRPPRVEAVLEKAFCERVKSFGGVTYKLMPHGRRSKPDRIGFLRGVMMLVEFKKPGEEPEPHQAREHARLAKLGFHVEVISTWEELDEYLSPMH